MLEILGDTVLSMFLAIIWPAMLALVAAGVWVLAIIAAAITFWWTVWRYYRRQFETE